MGAPALQERAYLTFPGDPGESLPPGRDGLNRRESGPNPPRRARSGFVPLHEDPPREIVDSPRHADARPRDRRRGGATLRRLLAPHLPRQRLHPDDVAAGDPGAGGSPGIGIRRRAMMRPRPSSRASERPRPSSGPPGSRSGTAAHPAARGSSSTIGSLIGAARPARAGKTLGGRSRSGDTTLEAAFSTPALATRRWGGWLERRGSRPDEVIPRNGALRVSVATSLSPAGRYPPTFPLFGDAEDLADGGRLRLLRGGEAEVVEDPADGDLIGQECDRLHLLAAAGADEGIDLVHLGDETGPGGC